MLFHSLIRLFALAGASFLLVPTAPAWAVNAQVGILKCDTSTGIGEIITRKQTMTCVFTKNDGTKENYTGSINEFGIELGDVKEGHLIWAVVSGSAAKDNGLLERDEFGLNRRGFPRVCKSDSKCWLEKEAGMDGQAIFERSSGPGCRFG